MEDLVAAPSAAEPLVSVIMNCYNGEKYLRQAIDSVRAQTYHNWEIIFWDNQSTDGSARIVESYCDPRVRYFYAPTHTWLYEARNYAIEQSRGEFIAFLDVDDRWLPTKLAEQLALFCEPDVGMACGNYWVESERNRRRWQAFKRPAPSGWVLNDLLDSFFVGLLTLVVRRSALDSLDYACDPRYHIIGDFDLVVRLATRWKLGCIQQPVAVYRLHDGNESAKHRDRQLHEFETWLGEMQEVEAIRSCPTLASTRQYVTYTRALHRLLQADKREAFRLSRGLPWGRRKLRLWIGVCVPTFVVRRLKK